MKKLLSMILCVAMLANLAVIAGAEAINPADGLKTDVTVKKADPANVVKDGIIGADEYVEVAINRDPSTTDLLLSWNDNVDGSSLLAECEAFLQNVHYYFSWDEVNGLNIAAKVTLLETPVNTNDQPEAGTGDEFLFQFGMMASVVDKENTKNDVMYRGISINTDTGVPMIGDYGVHGYNDAASTFVAGENYMVSLNGNEVTYEISYPIEAVVEAADRNGNIPNVGAMIMMNVSLTGGSLGTKTDGAKCYAVSLGDGGYMTNKWAGSNLSPAKIYFSDETFGSVDTDPIETDPIETDPIETDPIETDPIETDPPEIDPPTWSFDEATKTVTFSGKGDMADIWDGQPNGPGNLGVWYPVMPESILHVVIEDGITTIRDNAFYWLVNLESVSIPESVTYIGAKAFAGCNKLKEITIPDSVTQLGEGAFEYIANTTKITLSKNITEIPANTFCGWLNITNIVIPAGITHIGKNAFAYNDSLATVNFEGTAEQWENVVIDSGNDALLNAKMLFGKQLFNDVPLDMWYAEYIQYAYENGLMKGVSSDNFAPEDKMDRSMVVTVLHRIASEPAPNSNSPFVDLLEDWYMDPVAWAYENDIVKGTGYTTFGPTESVTREQLATFLYRFSSYMGYDMSASADLTAFPDHGKASDWATEALRWAIGEGLIAGSDEGGVLYLNPDGTATRAEVATILTRFCKKH